MLDEVAAIAARRSRTSSNGGSTSSRASATRAWSSRPRSRSGRRAAAFRSCSRAATRPRAERPIPIAEPAVVAMYTEACKAALRRADRLRALQRVRGSAAAARRVGGKRHRDDHVVPQLPAHARAGGARRQVPRAERLGADVAKVAVMPRDPQDVLTLLAATYRAGQTIGVPLITMSMGGVGSLSRIMGWVYGSAADVRRRQEQLGAGTDRHRGPARGAGHRPRAVTGG